MSDDSITINEYKDTVDYSAENKAEDETKKSNISINNELLDDEKHLLDTIQKLGLCASNPKIGKKIERKLIEFSNNLSEWVKVNPAKNSPDYSNLEQLFNNELNKLSAAFLNKIEVTH